MVYLLNFKMDYELFYEAEMQTVFIAISKLFDFNEHLIISYA